MRIGIIGSAVVGQTMGGGLKKHGHEVRIASRSPQKLAEFSETSGIPAGTPSDVAAWAEALVLAVKGTAAESALREAGAAHIAGKLVIDTTNPIANEPPEDGVLKFFTSPNDSLMERLQKAFPEAKFVKAFNSVGSALMVNPAFPGGAKGRCFTAGTMRVRRNRWRESSSSLVGSRPTWERRKRLARSSRFANSGASRVFAATTGRPTRSTCCGADLAPARLLVGADAERDLADDFVRQQRVRRMEPAGARVAEQPLELALLEHAEAAREIERAVGDAERRLDRVILHRDDAQRTSRRRDRRPSTSPTRSPRCAAPSSRAPSSSRRCRAGSRGDRPSGA